MEERWWVSSDSSGLTTIMILGYVCYHFLPLFIAIFIIATKVLSGAHNLLKRGGRHSGEQRLDSAEGSLVREGLTLC